MEDAVEVRYFDIGYYGGMNPTLTSPVAPPFYTEYILLLNTT